MRGFLGYILDASTVTEIEILRAEILKVCPKFRLEPILHTTFAFVGDNAEHFKFDDELISLRKTIRKAIPTATFLRLECNDSGTLYLTYSVNHLHDKLFRAIHCRGIAEERGLMFHVTIGKGKYAVSRSICDRFQKLVPCKPFLIRDVNLIESTGGNYTLKSDK